MDQPSLERAFQSFNWVPIVFFQLLVEPLLFKVFSSRLLDFFVIKNVLPLSLL